MYRKLHQLGSQQLNIYTFKLCRSIYKEYRFLKDVRSGKIFAIGVTVIFFTGLYQTFSKAFKNVIFVGESDLHYFRNSGALVGCTHNWIYFAAYAIRIIAFLHNLCTIFVLTI